MVTNFRHPAENLRREVETILHRVGLLCRVFARGKENLSLKKKLERETGRYAIGARLIQDAVGIRVALYFSEDVEIVARLLEKEFLIDRPASTVDLPNTDQFAVTRHNLIFKVPEPYVDEMKRAIGNTPVDLTFEVQLRSILSEGWHEVEHDLRYKSKKNWETQKDLSRALNGIIATIETAEWSMRKIFDDLAYRNYKSKQWPEMLHNKVRMRTEPHLSTAICQVFDGNNDIAKGIFRIDRKAVISLLHSLRPSLPISLDNIVYVWNFMGPNFVELTNLTPKFIIDTLSDSTWNVVEDQVKDEISA